MSKSATVEKQYQFLLKRREEGLARFGLMSSQTWQDDPKRLAFLLARYKFVAKMLSGLDSVLEVGCADAFGSRIVRQEVSALTVCDFDPLFIENAKECMDFRWPYKALVHDMTSGPLEDGPFAAAYALDVIEHISVDQENAFVLNIATSLEKNGILILGCPSIQSQAYASGPSLEGHVNCKDGSGMRNLLKTFFNNAFIFSMNDEVVHTGFFPMANYILGIGCGKLSSNT